MITTDTKAAIEALAKKTLSAVVGLPNTQALIIRNERKFDRIDTKILKEAEKINRKEYLSDVKCEGARPSKRKGSITYKSYSIDFKKRLIASIRQELENSNACLSKLIREKARQLKIHPKNITRWYHAKEIKKKEGGRKALFPEMEVRLANFILNNPSMRRKYILHQARQILEELQVPGREDFNFSKGWYERFRERLNKSKVFAQVKTENDCLKYEVKLEHFEEPKDHEGVKLEEDLYDYEDADFDSDAESSEHSSELVKL
jgi:hypothetical protein